MIQGGWQLSIIEVIVVLVVSSDRIQACPFTSLPDIIPSVKKQRMLSISIAACRFVLCMCVYVYVGVIECGNVVKTFRIEVY
jgi:hypothetical protein